MIGLDSNVLLRVFVDDTPIEQSLSARSLVSSVGRNGVRVCLVVLVETIWTMRRTFGFGRAAITDFIVELLDRPEFEIEDRDLVEAALEMFIFRRVDFADCLIAVTNARAACQTTYTFDEDASALDQFTWLETKA
jgi:predicted nucleic-acid-binding protein